ncbi:MAG: diaminobutyrate--2-oxoglutarate transaminase [Pirellula sp.]
MKLASSYAISPIVGPVEPVSNLACIDDVNDIESDTTIFEHLESNVRTYCRSFPAVFTKASGALLFDEHGKQYIDFLAGAGALNYGHNPKFIQHSLIEYLQDEGIVQGLDLHTVPKRKFLETFEKVILEPRGLDYKVQFCGPTGANSIEAALKLARLATGRTNIVSFTGGWHGMSAGCLAITGNLEHRAGAGVPLSHVVRCPYPVGPFAVTNGLELLQSMFRDSSSGVELPAAIILETVQGEGGIYVAPTEWLQQLRKLCDRFGILLIVDDVQAGCGRTGTFFSFERAGIEPDIVCLSKSIGGYGLPMSLVLMRRSLDCWKPGLHTGTFRGNQLAYVAATAALQLWQSDEFAHAIADRAQLVEEYLRCRIAKINDLIEVRGIGLIWGVDLTKVGGSDLAKRVSRTCFANGLIVERCGRGDETLKILPPLNISKEHLLAGFAILEKAILLELSFSIDGVECSK